MGLPWLLPWLLLPGCWALTGPHSVQALVGGSLSVSCKYKDGLETHEKFWCRAGNIYVCAGPYIIATSEHKAFVRKDRISIWDDQTRWVFTVIMRNLTEEDAGTYRCGVERAFREDRHTVKVNVFPATRHWASNDTAAPPVTVPQPPSWGTAVMSECCSTLSPTSRIPAASLWDLRYFPVVVGLQLLALVAGIAAVLWVSARPC